MARNFKQFYELKAKHPDALLLFRCGDFYECYKEDATNASNVLGLTITSDIKEGVMCGFPHHALDTYLPKLIRAGHRVAICDQLDNNIRRPITKRGATETPAPVQTTRPKANRTIEMPKLTKQQYDLLCECIRYRAADNQKEFADAQSRGHFTAWYYNLMNQLEELKDLLYNLK